MCVRVGANQDTCTFERFIHPAASGILLRDREHLFSFLEAHRNRRFITHNITSTFRSLRSLLFHADRFYHERPDAIDNHAFHPLEQQLVSDYQQQMWDMLCELVNQSRFRDIAILDSLLRYASTHSRGAIRPFDP